MTTTLHSIKPGDEILSIGRLPAARVTVGIPWDDANPQRLIVKSVWSNGTTCMIRFMNGGVIPAAPAKTPCTVA